MFNIITKEFQYGNQQVTLETGRIAAKLIQWSSHGRRLCASRCCGKDEGANGSKLFPLTVNYQEKMYAAGKIPGGYGKREGRPSEMETLTSRLIDRPIRPLFPEGYLTKSK